MCMWYNCLQRILSIDECLINAVLTMLVELTSAAYMADIVNIIFLLLFFSFSISPLSGRSVQAMQRSTIFYANTDATIFQCW